MKRRGTGAELTVSERKRKAPASRAFFLIAAGLLGLLSAAVSAASRPSLNVYFQATLNDAAYQKGTFEKVSKAWKTPAASEVPAIGKKTVVQAVIAKDGKLVSAVVSLRSGKKGWDAAALSAVRTAAPFDSLPASYGYPTIEVHFHVSVVP